MMSFSNPIKKLENTATCYNVEYIPRPHGGTIVKMYCPMLMPDMGYGTGSSSADINVSRIFINDSACKPSIPSSVRLQQYIQFTCQYNSTFDHLVDIIDHLPVMTKLQGMITNGLPIIRTFSTDT